ncbi:SinI family restriction endonuclease [Edaphobacter bradus]|uniref:SinI family restriction endonuclease n=1 Tax=Edaphobacter bradus TaxID=2259016 RepID=UPI0021DFC9BE|nr:SinI family restriction endonuclease [Edaphobacter bradus]
MLPVSKNEFLAIARKIAASEGRPVEANFAAFLSFAHDNPFIINQKDKIHLETAKTRGQIETFLSKYVRQNLAARDERISYSQVATIADPAVDVVLEVFGKHPKHELARASQYHRASMAAENMVGGLLEHYLAKQLEPHGWFWCACNIIRGVDFFKDGNPITLLQVKNRSNSENSSSSLIRKTLLEHGCPVEIDKWHRTNSQTGQTCWDELPGNSRLQLASEEGFHKFLRTYIR